MVALSFLETVPKGTKPFYYYPLFSVGVVTVVVIAALYWFFGTERGASIRATGANEHMARAQGINTNLNKMLGLMLANALVALSGALFTQYQGSAEINMGRGAIVIGLAAIFIGLSVSMKIKPNFVVSLIGVVGGGIVYYIVYNVVILMGLKTDYLKMLSALIVALFLGIPYLKATYFTKHKDLHPSDLAAQTMPGGDEHA